MGLKNKNCCGLILILTMFLGIIGKGLSQDIPAVSQGKLKFYFDTASFIGKADSTYQEFYLMFHSDQLKKIELNTDNKILLYLETEILDHDYNQVSSRDWITEVNLQSDSIDLREMVTFDQWGEYLIPGNYNVFVKVKDSKDSLLGTLKDNIDVKRIVSRVLKLSDIQFVFKVEELTHGSIFRKAGRDVYPNVWRRYGVLNPRLKFYYEIYGIDITTTEPLQADYTISDKNHNVIKKIAGVELKREDNPRSVLQAIDVSNLPSSVYYLNVAVTDSNSGQRAEAQRNFEIIQFDRYSSQSVLSEEDIEMFDELLSYLADENEYKTYKRLNDTEKEQFIVNFWKSKDPNPVTQENEYLKSVIEKFNYANNNFTWGNQPGWKSDRGRILIRYGMPTNIDSYTSEQNSVPYEVWTYQLEKNYIFVFADRRANGKYILIHSDMIGEVNDPTWMNLIRK